MTVLIWIAVLIVVGGFLVYFRNFVLGIWQDGGRGQFLVMGMPAVITMVLGISAFTWASMNISNLDVQYSNLAQRAKERGNQLAEEKRKEQKIVGVTQATDDKRQKELDDVQEQERIYLRKLIRLQPDNPDHKYNLALLKLKKGEVSTGINQLLSISPFDEPGYAKGHLYLAKHYLRQRPKSDQEKIRNQKRAEKQINNCLIADKSNVEAKRILAFILDQQKAYLKALDIYKELFVDEPEHYRDILRLTRILGRDKEAESYLSTASTKFRQKTDKSSDVVADWVKAWTSYVDCMKELRTNSSYTEALESVKAELLKYGDDIGKKVFLERLLSRIYSDRAALAGRDASKEIKLQQLSDLANSMENDEKNIAALQWLTILGYSDVGDQAKKIYDPVYDPNPPWVVLSEQGHYSLKNKEYDDAITHFERARKKQPRNPQILNNLAYSYLLSPENRNPEQALLLVDQAITNLNNLNLNGKVREEVIASFFDTRGVALMQLDRYKDAAAAFEIAFRNRKDSKEIIERLIECYTSLGNERQAEAYRRRLENL